MCFSRVPGLQHRSLTSVLVAGTAALLRVVVRIFLVWDFCLNFLSFMTFLYFFSYAKQVQVFIHTFFLLPFMNPSSARLI